MTIKDFLNKFASMHLWGNLFAMLLMIVLLAVAVKIGIDLYTKHGKVVIVPNVEHKQFDEAQKLVSDAGMEIEISDTGYVKSLPPDCILTQSLPAGDEVKPGRVLYVTVNASSPKAIALPDVIDNCSFREAQAKLRAMGFKLGNPQYVPGERDWLYGIRCQGRALRSGERVSVEDLLILQVGSGSRDPNEKIEIEESEYIFKPESPETYSSSSSSSEENEGEVDEFEVITSPETE